MAGKSTRNHPYLIYTHLWVDSYLPHVAQTCQPARLADNWRRNGRDTCRAAK